MGRPSRREQWQALRGTDKADLLAAAFLLPAFWLGLRLFGLRRWRAFLLRSMPAPKVSTGACVARLACLVRVAERHSVFPVTCLSRSLLLEWMGRRRGIEVVLCIGVRRQAQGLEAHAWVECAGQPIDEEADIARTFLPFAWSAPGTPMERK